MLASTAAGPQVVVNCFVMSYGVDLPTVECIVLTRTDRARELVAIVGEIDSWLDQFMALC